jgi:hypothetical protein
MGCTVVNPDPGPGCTVKGKTIAKMTYLAVVFLFILIIARKASPGEAILIKG